ncbi:MAG: hypothetical protein EBZ48_13060, partial [Proteobacteria bacterium]|nr:hypothetical protein [Pseudomonadota bacterium]
ALRPTAFGLLTAFLVVVFLSVSAAEALPRKKRTARQAVGKHISTTNLAALNELVLVVSPGTKGELISSTGALKVNLTKARVLAELPSGNFLSLKLPKSKRFPPKRQGKISGRQAAEVSRYQLSICSELNKSSLVVTCGVDRVTRVQRIPGDPRYSEQYGHQRVDSERAWQTTTGSSGNQIVIGVVDSGVDYNHPDLRDNMWTNTGEIPGNGIDDDGNGYIDDVHGWNSSLPWWAGVGNGDPADGFGHGTHCAGIIGARGDNNLGVAGVNWRTKIMALRFLTDSGWGFNSDALEAFQYVLTMKQRGVNIRVLNNSWGGSSYDSWLEQGIRELRNAGIIFVAAAGNSAENNDVMPSYPASYQLDNMVSVAATNDEDRLVGFSSYGGNTVHLTAPGDSILSTVPAGNYEEMSGTSMAAPFVAGALGLLLGYEPELTYKQAIERLLATGKPVAALEGVTTSGRILNIGNLIQDVRPAPLLDPAICSYTVNAISYVAPPDLSGETKVLPQYREVDGWPKNYTLNLPFSFPFYSEQYTSVVLGINGIMFFQNPLNGWEVMNYPYAPPYSIAPLHSSLFRWGLSELEGVWVQSTPSEVKIQWRIRSAINPPLGVLTITVSLFPDGTIRQVTSLPNQELARLLARYSLSGIRGGTIANSLTLANNGFPITLQGNQAFEYVGPTNCVASAEYTPPPTAT